MGFIRSYYITYQTWNWYIYRHEWLIFYGFHVGRYTSPMDGMGMDPVMNQPGESTGGLLPPWIHWKRSEVASFLCASAPGRLQGPGQDRGRYMGKSKPKD